MQLFGSKKTALNNFKCTFKKKNVIFNFREVPITLKGCSKFYKALEICVCSFKWRNVKIKFVFVIKEAAARKHKSRSREETPNWERGIKKAGIESTLTHNVGFYFFLYYCGSFQKGKHDHFYFNVM